MRRAAKVDRGSQNIVKGLRAYGATVAIIGRPVDLLCGYRRKNYLFEVKAEHAKPRRDQPQQSAFVESWRGQVAIVKNLHEAILALREGM